MRNTVIVGLVAIIIALITTMVQAGPGFQGMPVLVALTGGSACSLVWWVKEG